MPKRSWHRAPEQVGSHRDVPVGGKLVGEVANVPIDSKYRGREHDGRRRTRAGRLGEIAVKRAALAGADLDTATRHDHSPVGSRLDCISTSRGESIVPQVRWGSNADGTEGHSGNPAFRKPSNTWSRSA